MKRVGAIVIGGGAMGAAVVAELTKRGMTTLLFERGALASGATGKSPGIVRAYHSDWYLANLATESFGSFDGLLGARRCGAIHFDPQWKLARLRQEVGRLNGRGGALEILGASEGRERFPTLKWRDGEFAVHEPRAGRVDPKRAVLAWTKNTDVVTGSKVDAILLRGRRAAGVVAGGKEYESDHVVVCAGTASAELLAPIGIALPATPTPTKRRAVRDTPNLPVVFNREEDGRGLAMAAPGARHLTVATGWSGCSLSVVPAVARRVADLLV